MNTPNDYILDVKDLQVQFATYGGTVKAVRGVSYRVRKGKTLGVVGESGCGKSVTVQAILQLIPIPPGKITGGSAKLNGREIIGLSPSEMNTIRGREIGVIFQDPMSSLNPTMKIGKQIAETVKVHQNASDEQAMEKAVALLEKTKIPEAKKRAQQYPFEFSGGMLQRAIIAMSMACDPTLLVADEPTTALDVTIQAQTLELMHELQKDLGMSIILITHDLGVIARMAHDVAVMYAGQVVESGPVDDIFYRSSHPYTLGLRHAMPSNIEGRQKKLEPIDGSPPDLFKPPKGCGYYARCPYAMRVCENQIPEEFTISEGHFARCWLQHATAPKVESELYQIGHTENA
ncbi:MAG: ABC transporter ATP-binding protein [Desulfobacterales bacterium]|jgi:oligopeptide/dipeptide ABC transporter ATP-binding protein